MSEQRIADHLRADAGLFFDLAQGRLGGPDAVRDPI